jgi:hypothetical protein
MMRRRRRERAPLRVWMHLTHVSQSGEEERSKDLKPMRHVYSLLILDFKFGCFELNRRVG